jgi:threonine dehydratase
MNFDRLRFVAERADSASSARLFSPSRCPKSGRLQKFLSLIGKRNVTEFNYRYHTASEAHVFVGVQVSDRKESLKLVDSLQKHGYPTLDLTDDEMAKNHIRHMVGGHAPRSARACTVLYRFEFPSGRAP